MNQINSKKTYRCTDCLRDFEGVSKGKRFRRGGRENKMTFKCRECVEGIDEVVESIFGIGTFSETP